MNPSRKSLRSWPAALLALVLLALLLTVCVGLYRALAAAEAESQRREAASLESRIEADLAVAASTGTAMLSRMAMRLASSWPPDLAAWFGDAARLMEDERHFRSIAVLGPDLEMLWSVPAREGSRPPLSWPPAWLLAATETGTDRHPEDATVHPVDEQGEARLVFLAPIRPEQQATHWLVASASLQDLVRDALGGAPHPGVFVSGRVGDATFVVPERASGAAPSDGPWRALSLPTAAGAEALRLRLALGPSALAGRAGALPWTVLVMGSLVSVLVAAAAWLGMGTARQARGLSEANRRLVTEVHERELAERELESLLTHDSLTGLPNREGMMQWLDEALAAADPEPVIGVLYLDLDRFKDINETLGHPFGDRLIRRVPGRIQEVLGDRDRIGRLGGDEFLVVTTRASRDDVCMLANAILSGFQRPFHIDEHRLFVSASIGMTIAGSDQRSAAELIQSADAAASRAKQQGRNRLAEFDREMVDRVEARLLMSRDIREAIEAREFDVVYQPIVDLEDLTLRGVEALLRWRHRDGHEVPTPEFIRVAEETGVVHHLGRYVLRQAFEDLADWQRSGYAAPWIAVNISGAQFREPGLVADLERGLAEHDLDPSRVHVEITEEVLIENRESNRRVLEAIARLGMPIAVDDFGIGYSSLAYLKNFPVSAVKIDRGFIRNLEHGRSDQAIVRAVCGLARDLSLEVVAEGIENEAQLRRLRGSGCRLGQGFLFSRALPADEIAGLLGGGPPWGAAGPAVRTG
ncbi:MAG: bifunctional diguanylate cyclase/phosphodiesterase [Wenzhouxiangellaceae bacterium]|nr:bifunctional diguanylate cyclase/phosphodiesterase [Wenzhouxiangellaceae bacterium]